jgi:Lactoylglutathione lyase and related lyases
MPLPKHVFNPPFNVVRTSHVVLGVTDLDRSLAFYQATLGLHLEDRTPSEAYLRGVEERQHHSLVLKKTTTPACEWIGFKVGSDEDLDKAAAFLAAKGLRHAFVDVPYQAEPCRRSTRSAPRSSSTSRWSNASACFSSTATTRACRRSARPFQHLLA